MYVKKKLQNILQYSNLQRQMFDLKRKLELSEDIRWKSSQHEEKILIKV